VTATYCLVPSSFTNEFHLSTEDAAIRNVEKEIKRENFIQIENKVLIDSVRWNKRLFIEGN
jgi:hypothetical protein